MNTIRRSPFLIAGAGAVALAAAPAWVRAQGAPTVVRVMGIPNDDCTSLVYAMKNGLFQKAGLDVRYEKGTSGAAVAAAVAGNQFDIGKSSVSSIFDAHEKGIPFMLIAPAAIYESRAPYAAFIYGKDATIRTGKDLDGAIVSLSSLSSMGRSAILAWMDKNGGDIKSVKFVEVPMSQAPAAIAQKRVTLSEIANPAMSAAMDTGNFKLLPAYDIIGNNYVFSSWFTTKEWSAKNPEAARAFARVIAEAATYTNAHKSETAAMMSEFTGVELPVIQKMQRVTDGTTLTPANVQPPIDNSARYGTVKAVFPAAEIIDPRAFSR